MASRHLWPLITRLRQSGASASARPCALLEASGVLSTAFDTRWIGSSASYSARVRRTGRDLVPRQAGDVAAEPGMAVEPAASPSLNLPAIQAVLQHPALVVTRPIEWGTVLLGFEQANRYTVCDEAGAVVAQLMEEEGSIGRAIGRQLLRTRRPFTATVLSADGSEVLFRIRRPFYFISSTMYIEDGAGEKLGEVQQQWHLWRRNYALFVGSRQFSAIGGGFLAWDFELKDEAGNTMALIDRNFQGFGKELFTDAGKYAIHFGSSPADAARELATAIEAQHPDRPPPSVTALARVRTDVQVIPTSTGNQLVVHRPLKLTERMIALAAAITIDYDYFSRHSSGGGGLLSPFIVPPMIPYPMPGGDGGAGAEGSAEGDPGSGDGPGGQMASGSGPDPGSAGEPLERDLGGGGDEWGGTGDDAWDGAESLDEEGGGGFFDSLSDFFDPDE
ncbi:hypothetical protein APUTEX25_000769 [Auxenochlorella protothecoides]|uniref:Phospholipid scramblase n=1 Tax=Auxenochlorella protothecoides TaxID=3075 RepID=A0A1D2A007_AUXPR|nr:hypothetical protein APUTEX25_000769 [Auxenochlorella protothecoides]|eukprot:RMZ52650.1 hypothetical protein APUTEX25_000769 [Auxenochlorella protothecoides]